MKNTFKMNVQGNMQDSMCYDSDTLICSYGTDNTYVAIAVRGCVKVYYKDECYYHFSEMPEELQDMFLKGTAYKTGEVTTEENNWHELECIRDGVYIGGDVFDMPTPATPKQLKAELKKELGSFIKED